MASGAPTPDNSAISIGNSAQLLIAELDGPLSAAAVELSRAAENLPTGADFHFYSNFADFKTRVENIQTRALDLLGQLAPRVGSNSGSRPSDGPPADSEDLGEWLINAQDDRLEAVDSALDEARRRMQRDRKRGGDRELTRGREWIEDVPPPSSTTSSRKLASNKKAGVPFHVPSIPKPQLEFVVPVDNSRTPFQHSGNATSENLELELGTAQTAASRAQSHKPQTGLTGPVKREGETNSGHNNNPYSRTRADIADVSTAKARALDAHARRLGVMRETPGGSPSEHVAPLHPLKVIRNHLI